MIKFEAFSSKQWLVRVLPQLLDDYWQGMIMIIVCITAAVVISSPFQHVESWQMPNGESKEVLVWEKREEQWKPNQPCSFSSPWQRQEAEEVQGCPSPSPRPPPGWAAGSPGSSASSPSSGEGESSMYSRWGWLVYSHQWWSWEDAAFVAGQPLRGTGCTEWERGHDGPVKILMTSEVVVTLLRFVFDR